MSINGIGIKSEIKEFAYQIGGELESKMTETAKNSNADVKQQEIKYPKQTKVVSLILLSKIKPTTFW